MIEKLKNNDLMKKVFIFFLLLQPLFDLKLLYSDEVMNIFHFSPSTIIRMVMVLLLFTLIFISKKHGKEEKWLYGYGVIAVIYFILHHINSLEFTANITGTFNYSIIEEIFYFIRMLIPIFLIYISYNIELNKTELKKIFLSITFTFSIVIIISSIFKFGIASYGGGALNAGFLDWFTNKNITVADSACQGIFDGANRLGVLLSALLPINLYYFLINRKNSSILIILLQIVSLMIIGTKVASYTWIITFIIILILYLIFCLFKKEHKISIKKIALLIIVFILGLFILSNSPLRNTKVKEEAEKESIKQEEANNNYTEQIEEVKDTEVDEKILYIKNLVESDYSYLWINKIYLTELYNYELDPDFWIEVIEYPLSIRHNDRRVQEAIIKRVISLNNNKIDKLFGIGYSRFRSSKIYLEEDFSMHRFSMGIIGVILLLGMYLITLVLALLHILKDFKKNFRFELLVYCCSLSIFVFTSILCGHVVDEMITYIFMALISAIILRKCLYKEKKSNACNEKELISVIIPAYNVEEYLEECIDSVINQKKGNYKIEIIIVNDASNDGTLELCKKYATRKDVIFINNKINKGLAFSRNEALKKSNGKYILFLDSDDLLYEDSIYKLYNIIKKTNSDIVISKLNSFNSKGCYGYYSDKYINTYKSGTIYENIELINCISVCGKLYKKEILEGIYFLNNTKHEDNSFTLNVLFKCNDLIVLPEYTYYRRIREGENLSIMQNLNYNSYTDLIKNYESFLKNTSKKIPVYLKLFMIRKLNNYILNSVENSAYESAKNDIYKFINYNFSKIYLIYSKVYFRIASLYKARSINEKKN